MVFLLDLLAEVLIRLVAGPWDRHRITQFFEQRGQRVREITWSPFATGWLSNWYDRFYNVAYDGGNGDAQQTTCRVSWRHGVVLMDEEEAGDGQAGDT